MELARVEGTIVSTAKADRLKNLKLLLVNLIGPDMKPSSNYLVAVDAVGAGEGEVVIVVRGSSATCTCTRRTRRPSASRTARGLGYERMGSSA